MLKESKFIENIKYYFYHPDHINENMPLLIYLHGIGERGDNLCDVEKYGLPKYINSMNHQYLVIVPQCHSDNFWDYHLKDIEIIIAKEYKKYKFDKDNIFILGSSMGAYGAWNYILQRPKLFKGIIAVAGGISLPGEHILEKIKDKAILIYHGDKDDVVNVKESIDAYNRLKKIGAINVELKIVKNDNHFLTSHAFKDKYMYEWLDKNIRGE